MSTVVAHKSSAFYPPKLLSAPEVWDSMAEECREVARAAGWTAQPVQGAREFLFVRCGHVFMAAFPYRPPAREDGQRREALRGAGLSCYVVESMSEWAAVLDFESRQLPRHDATGSAARRARA